MNQKMTRIGIIGFGGAGMAQIRHFQAMPGCEVVAIFDPKEGGLARAAERAPSIPATANWDDFVKIGLDAVAVCSPDNTHADYIIKCIKEGIHSVCEKPLADSLEDCRRILQAQSSAPGVIAAVQHQMRFLPVHRAIKKLVDTRALGPISYIEGYYVHNLTHRASVFDNWRFTDNATPLVYAGCHFVDLFRWILGEEVEEVMAMANHKSFPEYPESDLNVVLLRFKSGIIAKLVVAFGAGRPQDHSIRIYGREKSIENNLLFSKDGSHEVFVRPHLPSRDATLPPRPKGFALRGHGLIPRGKLCYNYVLSILFEWLMKRAQGSEYGVVGYPLRLYPHYVAVRDSLQNFIDAIEGRAELECPLNEAARTVATCLAGVDAYRTGQPVKMRDYWLPEFD
jgi:predicted dehydrogenase